MIPVYYTSIKDEFDFIWILSTDRGLFSVLFDNIDEENLKALIESNDCEEFFDVTRDDERLQDVSNQIKDYLNGEQIEFDFAYDLSGATQFQQEVWSAIQKIPYGETRTYSWVAKEIGRPRAVRAVGNALAANPLPIVIPCHRVVGISSLGGYSGGLEWKKHLLKLEGYEFEEE